MGILPRAAGQIRCRACACFSALTSTAVQHQLVTPGRDIRVLAIASVRIPTLSCASGAYRSPWGPRGPPPCLVSVVPT